MSKQLDPITPGEILLHEFMTEYNLSQNRLALEINVPVSFINGIVKNKRRINADIALRLGKYFNTSAKFWMNTQTSYDLRQAERKNWPKIKSKIGSVTEAA